MIRDARQRPAVTDYARKRAISVNKKVPAALSTPLTPHS